MKFIDLWKNGRFGVGNVLATIFLIILAYLLGSSFLSIELALNFPDFSFESNSDIKALSSLMGKNRLFIWMLIPFCFVFITFLLCLTKIHKVPLLSIFTARESFDWNRVLISFSLWSLMIFCVTGIGLFFNDNFEVIFNPQKFALLFLLALFLLPVQTTIEELVFRGYLIQGINKRTGNIILSIITSGIMFGVMHMANPEILKIGYHILLYYIAVGVVLGFIVYYDDGLELTLGFHAANNIITVLLITADWQAFQTDAILKDNKAPGNGIVDILLGTTALFLFFFILSKKYKWQKKLV